MNSHSVHGSPCWEETISSNTQELHISPLPKRLRCPPLGTINTTRLTLRWWTANARETQGCESFLMASLQGLLGLGPTGYQELWEGGDKFAGNHIPLVHSTTLPGTKGYHHLGSLYSFFMFFSLYLKYTPVYILRWWPNYIFSHILITLMTFIFIY